MTYRALLVGNSQYRDDSLLENLYGPHKDVARLHAALTDPDTGMFDDADVRLEYNLSKESFRQVLDEFCSSLGRQDLLLFYYSGHGLVDLDDTFYLATTDTKTAKLFHTALSHDEINGYLREAESRRTVIILDCCKSGMFKSGGQLRPALGAPGRFVITSSTGAALTEAARTAAGTSPFTEHLVRGLRGAAPDVDGDGCIDLREIYGYVKDQMGPDRPPHCLFDGDGEGVSLARTTAKAPAIAWAKEPDSESVRWSSLGRYPRGATFALTESTIVLTDVRADEHLDPEVVRIQPLGPDDLDLAAEAVGSWLDVSLHGDRLTVGMRPKSGANRGKIVVTDRRSGSTQVLRIDVFVRAPAADGAPDSSVVGTRDPSPDAQTERTAQHRPEDVPVVSTGVPVGYWPPPATPAAAPPAPPPPVSTRAVVALVLAVVWLYGLGSVLALVLAARAAKEVDSGRPGRGIVRAARIIGVAGIVLTVFALIAAATESG